MVCIRSPLSNVRAPRCEFQQQPTEFLDRHQALVAVIWYEDIHGITYGTAARIERHVRALRQLEEAPQAPSVGSE
jgi:hypothetical protein